MSKSLTAADRKSLIRLASALPTGDDTRRAILAGLSKTAGEPNVQTAIKQVVGKLVNDRAVKKYHPKTKGTVGKGTVGNGFEILLDGTAHNGLLNITIAENEGGLGFSVAGKKDGKTHIFAQSRRPVPPRGSISKVFKPIMAAVGEWEAGLQPLFKAAASKDQWVKLFDELASKRRKTIQLDMSGVMGGGTNGMREFSRGRMGKPKQWRGSGSKGPFERVSLSILPLDDQGQPIKMRDGYKLWRSLYEDGSASISASIGNMGIMIKDMKA